MAQASRAAEQLFTAASSGVLEQGLCVIPAASVEHQREILDGIFGWELTAEGDRRYGQAAVPLSICGA